MDALNLFVSNSKAYFAELNDCAICYGVLAVDRTLPSKKCPNGHLFHAICLFKVRPVPDDSDEVVVQKFAWLNLSYMYSLFLYFTNSLRQGHIRCVLEQER
jgi:hypothetical protein